MSKDSFPVIHALIPARSGSKGIPMKNIKIYKGHPLLAYSILTASSIKKISKVVVSTDCEKIRTIAKKYGAESSFLRPREISGDYSTDLECFQQYVSLLKFRKELVPDIIVHLRPTYPERSHGLLQDCISTFVKNYDKYDSLRTIIPLRKSLFKMYMVDNNKLIPTYKQYKNIQEPHNQVRQILPTTYLHNGCIDIVKTKTIENNSMTGNMIYPYMMSSSEQYDIDTKQDWDSSLGKSNPINIPQSNKRNKHNTMLFTTI